MVAVEASEKRLVMTPPVMVCLTMTGNQEPPDRTASPSWNCAGVPASTLPTSPITPTASPRASRALLPRIHGHSCGMSWRLMLFVPVPTVENDLPIALSARDAAWTTLAVPALT